MSDTGHWSYAARQYLDALRLLHDQILDAGTREQQVDEYLGTARNRPDEASRRKAAYFILFHEHPNRITADLEPVDDRFCLIVRGNGHGEVHVLGEAGGSASGHSQAADDRPIGAHLIKISSRPGERRFNVGHSSLLDGGPG